ncbi:MAG: hypothetical protein V3U11_09490 [Planctomycetota bacterium]
MAKDLGCNKTRKLLALLPGSDLPPELDQPVRDHLAGCRVCQRQLGDHLRVRSALGGLWSRTSHPHVDATFFATMKGAILGRVTSEEALRAARLASTSSRRLVLARWMTAAAMLLLAVYLLPQMIPDTTPDLPHVGHTPANAGSFRDDFSRGGGSLPAVGLRGQEEVLRKVLVLDGTTFRWIEPWPERPKPKPKPRRSR